MFQTKAAEHINTHFVFRNFFFLNRAIYEIMWKNTGERGRPYGASPLRAGYLKLQIHTLRIHNTHFFSIATMVARTLLNVTLYLHCLSYCNWERLCSLRNACGCWRKSQASSVIDGVQ